MQSLIKFENNHVFFDFETKPNQKIKIIGTYDNPYFCGIDVCNILEHKDIKKSLFKLDSDYKKDLQTIIEELKEINPNTIIGMPSSKPSYNEGKAIYLSKDGLVAMLTKSRTLASYRVSQVISDKLGLNLKYVYNVSKQQQTLDIIRAAFKTLTCIPEYKVGTYRIDLYFPDLKVAVECDEYCHIDRDQQYEHEREQFIKNKLCCLFVRYNPDSSCFNIGNVICEINNVYIKYVTGR
jgi:prophage antirepressor-like protein